MYQTLYRKYRPSNFDEVVGQKHIIDTLKGQIENNKFSHAYLFCGTRGTGKTTCARILAKAINCTSLSDGNPCNECDACRVVNSGNSVDIIEIDAASNNGVESIRALVEEVRYTPVELKKRVYIIDEVHMLTIQAFNALLKTLEEPPEHVVFILATTEIHKIPATIMSRCQRFDFKRIEVDEITDSIMSVAGAENISIERDAAKIIARMSDGAMRNAYSMLESCIGIGGMITKEIMINRLGISNRETLLRLIGFIAAENSAGALKTISEIYETQSDFTNMLNEMLKIYRDLMILKAVPSCEHYLECYDNELPALKEICAKLNYSDMCKHSDVLRSLLENADRYGNTIRPAFEISVIKLCDKPIVIPEIDMPTAPKKTKEAVQKPLATEEKPIEIGENVEKSAETAEVPAAESASSAYSALNTLREEMAKRASDAYPFFEKAEVERHGARLFVVCSDMLAKMILSSSNNLSLMKSIAAAITPDITDVVVTDKATKPKEEDFNF